MNDKEIFNADYNDDLRMPMKCKLSFVKRLSIDEWKELIKWVLDKEVRAREDAERQVKVLEDAVEVREKRIERVETENSKFRESLGCSAKEERERIFKELEKRANCDKCLKDFQLIVLQLQMKAKLKEDSRCQD